MPKSPPSSSAPTLKEDSSDDARRSFLAPTTKSLTPTTGLSLPSSLFDNDDNNNNNNNNTQRRTKPSVSSIATFLTATTTSDVAESPPTTDALLVERRQDGGEDDNESGLGVGDNAGPRVHAAGDSGEQHSDSDAESDGPPPWMSQSKAEQGDAAKAPVLLRHFTDSQSLLREQLRKSTAPAGAPSTLKRPPPSTAPSQHSVVPASSGPLTRRKYFILTIAGKPVWSSEDEDEVDVTGQSGVIQAVISIFADEGDKLRYVDAGNVKIAVMLKPPVYLVASSDWDEPESILRLHLEYLHLLLLSTMSHTQLTRILTSRPSYDLRRSLHGTEKVFSSLTERLNWDCSLWTGSLEVFRCEASIKEEVGKILTPVGGQEGKRGKELLYAMLLASGKVVTLVRPRKHSVHPSESWFPVCLPRYNATGFLHAYVSFPHPCIGLIFVSGNREGFFDLKDWASEVVTSLQTGLEGKIWSTLTKHSPLQQNDSIWKGMNECNGYSVGEVGVVGIRHFIYKHKTLVQITCPNWESDYDNVSSRSRLITSYQKCHDLIHGEKSTAKFLYFRQQHEAVIGWMATGYELYLAVSPMLSKTATVSAAHNVVKWVKLRESRLFLISAPSF